MIEISNLSYAHGNSAVFDGASFKVNNGRIYGIYGEKGSGKSTLLALLAGAILPDEGSVRINGFDTAREELSAKRCVGYFPQNARFYAETIVYELLAFVADAKGVNPERRFLHVHQIMEELELEELRDRLISKLSPLDAALLGLAQALVGSPEILLLDAPTEGLSRFEAQQIRAHVRELLQGGKTVFFASASPIEIVELCDEVLILQNGEILPATPLTELLQGTYLTLEAASDAAALEHTLAESGQVAACRRLPSSDKNTLRYALKTTAHATKDSVEEFLKNAGIDLLSVSEEEPSDAEYALRQAAGTAKTKTEKTEEEAEA